LSIPRTQELYKSNLRTFWDLWRVESRDFHSWDELKFLFPLEKKEYSCWQWLINSLFECWIKEPNQPTLRYCDGEWLGMYNDETMSNPINVFAIIQGFQPYMLTIQFGKKWSFQRRSRYSRLESTLKHFDY
jgi:hypothetical protein